MRLRLPFLLLVGLVASGQDPRDLVRRSLQQDHRNEELVRNYAFLETVTEQHWRNGVKAGSETMTYEITILYGEPYRRMVKKNGKPLSAEEDAKQQKKLDKVAAERAKESPEQRERRIAKYVADRRKERGFLDEIPDAYDFRIDGESTIAGRAAWTISAEPKPGYKPRRRNANLLTKFRGKLYIAKEGATLLKLDAEAIDSLSFGWGLAKLDRGGRISLDRVWINNEIWMPSRLKFEADARLGFVKKLRLDLQIDYTEFRRFQSDSRLVPAPEN